MTVVDERGAIDRIHKAMFAIGVVGVLIALFWKGGSSASGFALGAAASYLNFRFLKRTVEALGDAGKAKSHKGVAVVAGLRYLLLGAGAYAILSFTSVSVLAAMAGLFVPVAAVIIEIIFQLVYARI